MTTIKEAVAKYLEEGGSIGYMEDLIDEARSEWVGNRVFWVSSVSDTAWIGAESGWYWGEVDGWGVSQGDSVGPFQTSAEAWADLKKSQKAVDTSCDPV